MVYALDKDCPSVVPFSLLQTKMAGEVPAGYQTPPRRRVYGVEPHMAATPGTPYSPARPILQELTREGPGTEAVARQQAEVSTSIEEGAVVTKRNLARLEREMEALERQYDQVRTQMLGAQPEDVPRIQAQMDEITRIYGEKQALYQMIYGQRQQVVQAARQETASLSQGGRKRRKTARKSKKRKTQKRIYRRRK